MYFLYLFVYLCVFTIRFLKCNTKKENKNNFLEEKVKMMLGQVIVEQFVAKVFDVSEIVETIGKVINKIF